MKRIGFVLLMLCCLTFSGCANIFDGSYVSVKPHENSANVPDSQNVSVSGFSQLYGALTEMIADGTEKSVISVANYGQDLVERDMERAVSDAMRKDPIAAYAVKEITFELGKSGGQPALAVDILYTHDRAEIRKIKQVQNVEQAVKAITTALNQCQSGVVLQVEEYEHMDFAQAVESYAVENPQYVMEQPQVTVNIYPESGAARVVELRFGYQTSRDSLKTMQTQVQPVFTSASLYVSGDAADRQKFSQLYSFLMKRFEYQLDTSITPAYSLLRHGVGDSRAFAMVYGAMCRQAGLECRMVSGTHNGESRYWNIICDEGVYYHLDLLTGSFRERTDEEMEGYVWDYSAYPQCGVAPQEQPKE